MYLIFDSCFANRRQQIFYAKFIPTNSLVLQNVNGLKSVILGTETI